METVPKPLWCKKHLTTFTTEPDRGFICAYCGRQVTTGGARNKYCDECSATFGICKECGQEVKPT